MNRTHFAVPNAMFVYNLTQDIPLIRTLSSVPRVSGLESFHFSWAPHVADHIDVASSSPLILFNLCYCTPILCVHFNLKPWQCHRWLSAFGITLVYATFLVKNYRIYRIFHNKKLEVQQVRSLISNH